MQVHLTKSDVIWSYVGIVVSMSANLLMLPIIIFFLDSQMLGLWYVFTSIGAISVLFDFGFSVTFARNITYCWSGARTLKKEGVVFIENSEPDFVLMRNVLVACKRIYLLLSGAVFILLISIGTLYIVHISEEIEGSSYLIAWGIYCIAVSLNLYYCYYISFLRGVGAIDDANKNTVIARLSQILLTFILLLAGMGLIGVCISYLVYGTLLRVLGKYKFYRYKGIGANLSSVKKETSTQEINNLIRIVWHNAWRDGLIQLSNYLSNQATIIISSLCFSLSETGIYSIGVQIAMAISSIAGTMYTASQPVIQAAYVNNDFEKIRKTMAVVITSFVYLFIGGTIAVVFIVLPLLKIIRPEAIVSIPVLLGLCFYHFLLKYRDCYTTYYSCTNRILYLQSFVVSSIVCVLLSFLFSYIFKWGVWGLIIAQVASQLMYNTWYWPWLAHKEINARGFVLLFDGTLQLKSMIINKIKHQ